MLSDSELARMREEWDEMERWRKISRHIVAELYEACEVCGMVRERQRLIRCRWCTDKYQCKDGLCSRRHQADRHPGVAYWTW